jgi:hypothetical protein
VLGGAAGGAIGAVLGRSVTGGKAGAVIGAGAGGAGGAVLGKTISEPDRPSKRNYSSKRPGKQNAYGKVKHKDEHHDW